MTQRRCGDCTLCCKLVPVADLNKAAGVRCKFQRHTGCAIYSRKPSACEIWSCMWLVGDDMGDMSRPDRSHYIIDPTPDYIVLRDRLTQNIDKIVVIQIWIDPRFPDAHRDPRLRAHLSKRRLPAIVRSSETDVVCVLFPPETAHDDEWHEVRTDLVKDQQHDMADIVSVMQQQGIAP